MKKQKITFKQWFAHVKRIADREGYELRGPMFAWERTAWNEMYDQKLTPRQAWDKA